MAKIGWGFTFACLVAVGGIAAFVSALPDTDPATAQPETEADHILSAQLRCQNQTKTLLADPDGFEAEPFGNWRATTISADALTFTFRARVKNSFGALIWADFECQATHDGAFWTAEVSQP